MAKITVKRFLEELLDNCLKNNAANFDVKKLLSDYSSARFAVKENWKEINQK